LAQGFLAHTNLVLGCSFVVRNMMSWIQGAIEDNELYQRCTMRRLKTDATGTAVASVSRLSAFAGHGRCDATSLSSLPDNFYFKLGELCCDDPQIAVLIEDDRTSQLIWGKAHSLRSLFLQMCIRGRDSECSAAWTKLREFERRELLSVFHDGQPSKDFFVDLMLNDEQSCIEPSDCGISESGRSYQSDSSYPSVSSIFYG